MNLDACIFQKADCVHLQPFPGVDMFVAESPQMTISLVEMAPHSKIPLHSHPQEQVGYLLEGEVEFIVAGRPRRVVAGGMWRLPGGTPHEVLAGARPARALDVFYPIREDMRG